MNYKYLFGPVLSRRLGISLGVDLTPYKICNLNCIYCESGRTTKQTLTREEYIPFEDVIKELDQYLGTSPNLDYITFSGAGEPTLNLRLGDIISYIKANYPVYKIALITNSLLFIYPEVRNEVLECDLILPSLDAATEEVFKKINRPLRNISVNNIINGLIELRKIFKGKIWLEIFLVPSVNDTENELFLLKEKVLLIKPDKLQLNTLDRPGTEDWLNPIPYKRLEEIRELFYPVDTEIISKNLRHETIDRMDSNKTELILQTLKRRPCTTEELAKITDLDLDETNTMLQQMIAAGKIIKKDLPGGSFYSL